MTETAALSATLEDYLEAISRLVEQKGAARVGDIAEAVGVHKSTVSSALKALAERELINYSPYALVTMTERGCSVAEEIQRRHEVISRFLREILSVEDQRAEENACRMEHVMDLEVLKRLSLFARFVRECPRAGEDWINRFRYYCEHDGTPPEDEEEMARWIEEFERKVRDRRSESGE